jgi:hypothetical protein
MLLYVADFLPNEQMLELFKPDHRVARAVAHQPFVGMYFNKCRRKSCPNLVIPRCSEGRIKGKRKVSNPNVRNTQRHFLPLEILARFPKPV